MSDRIHAEVVVNPDKLRILGRDAEAIKTFMKNDIFIRYNDHNLQNKVRFTHKQLRFFYISQGT